MFSATKGGSPSGYQISRSVRLRSSASAYFNRTLTTPTSSQKFTWSGWTKRGKLDSSGLQGIFCPYSSGTVYGYLAWYQDGIRIFDRLSGGTNYLLQTTAVYRDPSAWYHIVYAVDTTQATAANRVRLYVNGVEVTSFSTSTYPTQNNSTTTNSAIAHNIGYDPSNVGYLDGYLTEINFIDGQALTPSSFGSTNATTGVWQPIKYTGTYGTNGFFLNFSDNSAATAAAIGKDYSGNGNNWTPNNISVTAGVTYDSMLDVPTQWADGGNGRGNYCVLNPLIISGLSGGATLSNGNLRVSGTNGVSNAYARGTMALSGKFYAEFFFDVVNATASIGVDAVTATSGALATSSTSVSYRSGGNKRVLGTESAYGASWVANDIIGVAVDTAANTVEFFKNGVSQGVITSSAFFAQGDCVFAMAKDDLGSPLGYANFGQRPFSYTPPTGFKALNTLNLPTPTILKGNLYFDVSTWSGTGGSSRSITGVNFQPDLVWGKVRNTTYGHMLFDSVRGAGSLKELGTNVTGAEGYGSSDLYGFLSAFNSDGFTVTAGTDGTIPNAYWNQSGNTYVGWQWKEGATQGFDIVTYTGTGVAGRTVAHNLGVAPAMYILKNRGATSNWPVYHKNANANPQNGGLYLNATDAFITAAGFWNNTLPTSSVFSTGSGADTNANGNTYVAYLFAEVAGYSSAFSYTGNGSADGPFVFCGFRPRWVMWKCSSDASTDWVIYDSARDTYNVMGEYLLPNSSAAGASNAGVDFLSNGFKIKLAGGGSTNTSGRTYIGFAMAENPFKNALAR